jgi:hypothetical protein
MKYTRLKYDKLQTYSIKKRKSKVSVKNFFNFNGNGFLEQLPDILAGKDLKDIVEAAVAAKKNNKKLVIAMGAHVIKVGLSPLLIELMKKGLIDLIAVNGACIIHDTETAMHGETSEDVESAIKDGNFGMCDETGVLLNNAINQGYKDKMGLGESVGKFLYESNFKYKDYSIIQNAYKYNIPVTVHVAVGTDIIHMHPHCSGAAVGETSLTDFKIFCNIIKELQNGIYFNIGSAVILPEIFLKAVTLVRNLGYELNKFTTVNLDFIKHYRPVSNVVQRPTSNGGKGFNITGHHEIMVPLIFLNILNKLEE